MRIRSFHTLFLEVDKAMQFNEIQDRTDLANFLGVSKKQMTYCLYGKGIDNLYTSFTIPKRNGGVRIIEAPNERLKYIQKKLANALYRFYYDTNDLNNNVIHGFTRGRSIYTNAEAHAGRKYIIKIDIKDFFHSIHFGRVRGYFEKNKYFELPREVATVIAQLTCYQGRLPQGAPTSPIISNLIASILDYRILKIAARYKLHYTRYADDLTFSTNNSSIVEDYEEFIEKVSHILEQSGFSINDDKTVISYRYSRQQVTGLITNSNSVRRMDLAFKNFPKNDTVFARLKYVPNVNREYYKLTRAMAHNLYSTGSFYINGIEGELSQLEGRFEFINSIDVKNDLKYGLNDHKNLNSHEREYAKFLFYKYFLASEKPIIVTEGFTDKIHLRAALKKEHERYSKLISKENDRFIFNLTFLSKTPRIHKLLGINTDGGSSACNILELYCNSKKDQSEKYPLYFRNHFELEAIQPVIIILDNESNSSKPLYQIMQKLNKMNSYNEDLDYNVIKVSMASNYWSHLCDNLYLIKIPGEPELEIEDLHTLTTLNTIIDHRSFSKENEYDRSKYYGKVEFAKYVSRNYSEIDFSGFDKLLDLIEIAIDDYCHKK